MSFRRYAIGKYPYDLKIPSRKHNFTEVSPCKTIEDAHKKARQQNATSYSIWTHPEMLQDGCPQCVYSSAEARP